MSGKFPLAKISAYTVGIMTFGYFLMKATVPTPEQTYNALAPDLKRQVDANRAARLARENMTNQQLQAQLNDPDAQKPVWSDSAPK